MSLYVVETEMNDNLNKNKKIGLFLVISFNPTYKISKLIIKIYDVIACIMLYQILY